MPFACPSCRAPLNPLQLAMRNPQRGVECPGCRVPLLQRPGTRVVLMVFFFGWLVLIPVAMAFGAGFEVLITVMLVWSAAMMAWTVLRPWVPAR